MMYEPAATKTELLQAISDSGGGDPYRMAAGLVRGVAIDRWCNELFEDGFITGDPDNAVEGAVNLAPYAEVTLKGQRWLNAYDLVKHDS